MTQKQAFILSRPKLIILGHAQHGKDTAAEILRSEYGFTFQSSSLFCAERVVRPYLAARGLHYDSLEQCYEARKAPDMRVLWHDAIWEYNSKDPTRLGRALFAEYDLYVGIRHDREFNALKNAQVFDYAVWIDRSDHVERESRASMKLEQWMADFTVDNNGDAAWLRQNLRSLVRGQKWA